VHIFNTLELTNIYNGFIIAKLSTSIRAGCLAGAKDCSVLHRIKIGSGALPGFYTVGIGGCSPELKRKGRDANHSRIPNAEVKNDGSISPLPHMS
jgi:hypothetical protein